MASKSSGSDSSAADRRAKIDQIRGRTDQGDRRRNFVMVGVCSALAVAIIGAAAYSPLKSNWDQRQFETVAVTDIGAPASVCQKVTTKPAEGTQQHEDEGTTIDYPDSPPAFGRHWNVWESMERKFYSTGDRPPLAKLVHNMEHGFTILWYDETVADDSDTMDQVRAIAKKYAGTNNQRLKFMAVPWTKDDGKPFPKDTHLALTHWSAGGVGDEATQEQVGVWQYCSEPSGAAVKAFMEEYPYMDSPEPGAV